ncbi:GDSL-type esterase/lipase family protein [Tenacibaculum sp. SG-28]|uniref:GDSL-type esterase/lipase family protein n=1 Tax=Tenacibaculum sp. SG-28 TaxID=754426 RepID=UPI000CF4B49C|nr:GDSL-type esterase/lipase family protein [Tenacibaculum sp. SG-28]PQJ23443.1 hypothetical protein BSU00_04470 [Tenacibaculum sp. SG-28]
MRYSNTYLIFILLLCALSACNNDEDITVKPLSTSINKILPLGASRVEGARPAYESFRYELWRDLKENEFTFDFIGTQTDDGTYPLFNNETFDTDHEGRGGWTSGQILDGLRNWLTETGAPDIVLFSSPGGNDGLNNLSFTKAVENINSCIDILQEANPNVTILIEQMAPGRTDIMTVELTNYFNQMQQEVTTIATTQSTATSRVITVDMYSGFTDSLLADDVHYNQAGAAFIAERYYEALQTVLVR